MTPEDHTNDKTDKRPPAKKPADAAVTLQKIWGVALVLAGIGVFFRIPQVMPRITETYPQYAQSALYIKFCFYLLGVLLIGGGAKKLYTYFRKD